MHELQTDGSKPYSFIDPKGMGGIIGGDGYTFQERYIVCQIPKWLNDPNFVRLAHEGTGDVDVVFEDSSKVYYDHVQVKDHNIIPSEFTSVVNTFAEINNGIGDKQKGKEYRKFILVAPSLSPAIKSLADALQRFRDAKKIFEPADQESMMKTTKDALFQKIEDVGLVNFAVFITEKVFFEIGIFDFNDNNTCRRQFISALTEHPKYKEYFNHLLHPVYSKLIEEVLAHRGKALDHLTIHNFIKDSLAQSPERIKDHVLHIHNWTLEKFSPEATVVLDWSNYFDRSTRRVPNSAQWETDLIPQLIATRKNLSASTVSRHVIFRGKCTLSTGFALGMAFPEIGNWTFEIHQYPQTWRSDAEKLKDFKLKYECIDPTAHDMETGNHEIALIFNITGQALQDVVASLKDKKISLKQLILIQPSNTPGSLSIQNDSEAVSLASASKDIIKEMLIKYKARKTHLFYYGPLGLSIFLGQKLTSVGQIQLYEFQDPGYKETCLIKT